MTSRDAKVAWEFIDQTPYLKALPEHDMEALLNDVAELVSAARKAAVQEFIDRVMAEYASQKLGVQL